jgi:hypothetical protein
MRQSRRVAALAMGDEMGAAELIDERAERCRTDILAAQQP